jgi:hypothetical protein
MQSERLTNLHPGWVVGGWLVAVAATAAVYIAGVGLGLVPPHGGALVWPTVSLAGGFFVGGLLVGMRWSDAPILHGAAITFLSVVVWLVALLLGAPGGPDGVPLALGLILVQLVASCFGGWMGRRWTLSVGVPPQ